MECIFCFCVCRLQCSGERKVIFYDRFWNTHKIWVDRNAQKRLTDESLCRPETEKLLFFQRNDLMPSPALSMCNPKFNGVLLVPTHPGAEESMNVTWAPIAHRDVDCGRRYKVENPSYRHRHALLFLQNFRFLFIFHLINFWLLFLSVSKFLVRCQFTRISNEFYQKSHTRINLILSPFKFFAGAFMAKSKPI